MWRAWRRSPATQGSPQDSTTTPAPTRAVRSGITGGICGTPTRSRADSTSTLATRPSRGAPPGGGSGSIGSRTASGWSRAMTSGGSGSKAGGRPGCARWDRAWRTTRSSSGCLPQATLPPDLPACRARDRGAHRDPAHRQDDAGDRDGLPTPALAVRSGVRMTSSGCARPRSGPPRQLPERELPEMHRGVSMHDHAAAHDGLQILQVRT